MRYGESEARTERGRPVRPGERSRDRRGAMLVLVAVAMVGLMGMLALSIDAGFLHRQRRMAQTAADAGAQAGAIEIFRGHRDSAVAAAHSETTRNGFTNGVDNVVVTVNNPPVSGPHTGDTLFVEVVVAQNLATFFGNVVNQPSVSLQPRAVGGVLTPANGCLYVLDPTAAKALEIKSSGELIGDDCAVVVNSNDPDNAISVSNNGSGLAASTVAVTGGSFLQSGSTAYIYCGGFEVDVSGVTMDPGLYILKGGGINIHTTDGELTGTGVSFINTNGLGNDPEEFDIINIHSGAVVHLSAMTTCALAGILFYQDPSAGKVGFNYTNRLHSGSASTVTGVIYTPTQKIELSGSGATLTINGGVVAKTVLMQSDGTVILGGGIVGGGVGAFTRAAIVE